MYLRHEHSHHHHGAQQGHHQDPHPGLNQKTLSTVNCLNMAELAELAASSSVTGWSSLFPPVLSVVFQHILGLHESPKELLTAWQPLALVCKAWHSALLATPLGLELKAAAHLSEAALRWVSKVQVEFLILPRSLDPVGADKRLLQSADFQGNSARALRSLVNAGPACLPLLAAFTNLQQVTIFEQPSEGRGPHGAALLGLRSQDMSPLRDLPKLHCLTIAGHFTSLSTSQLPPKLRHLTLSCYSEGGGIDLELPQGLEGPLEYLDCKADYVLLDWMDVCQRCQDVTICGDTVMMKVGQDSVSPVQALVDPQLSLYRRFGACISQGEEIEQVVLAFFHLALYSGDRDLGASLIDADDFLETLRGDLLGSYDVDPAFEAYPYFVRGRPAEHPCFVLSVAWQGEGGPRSFHFTTPITSSEHQLLLAHPVWQLAWCRDPMVKQLLTDPAFISRSGPTLANLTNISLWPGADLTPFTALKVLMLLGPDAALEAEAAALAPVAGPGDIAAALGVAGGATQAGGAPEAGEGDEEVAGQGGPSSLGLAGLLRSVQLPEGLESLCLSAENVQAPQDFSADWLPHLPHLQEFGLFNYRHHNLRRLPPSVTCVRIMNPRLEEWEAVGGPGLALPHWPPAQEGAGDERAATESGGQLGGRSCSRGREGREGPKPGESPSRAAGGVGGAEGGAQGSGAGVANLDLGRLALSRSSSGASSFESAQSSISDSHHQQQLQLAAAADPWGEAQNREDCPEPGSANSGGGSGEASGSGAGSSASAAAGSGSSNGGPGSRRGGRTPHHHHRHSDGRGHGGREGIDDGGEGHACSDPNCPLHSGKRFLQLSFTDGRARAAVELGALLGSGAHMVTIACDTSHHPTVLELRHEGPLTDILQRMNAAGVDTLELTCDPGSTYFAGEGTNGRPTLLAGLLSAVAPALQAGGGGSGRVPLLAGLRRLAAVGTMEGARWEVKSFDGETIHEGVVDGAKSWALLRRAPSQQEPGSPLPRD